MEEKSQQVKRRADMDLRRKNRNRVLDMTMVSLFCVLMIVSAKIRTQNNDTMVMSKTLLDRKSVV